MGESGAIRSRSHCYAGCADIRENRKGKENRARCQETTGKKSRAAAPGVSGKRAYIRRQSMVCGNHERSTRFKGQRRNLETSVERISSKTAGAIARGFRRRLASVGRLSEKPCVLSRWRSALGREGTLLCLSRKSSPASHG